ncbi:hypothetical protein DSM112329_02994 [Paraconexibacter sp. AEG42_29]|uniref:DUF5655 domain-containing protein n=1 Tax=Paraconexibacter sp. AEG42_29 TaxID=2997339 RepID=A0AAU7AWX1_9ACTN
MVRTDAARSCALALPGCTEEDHHGRPSFRVCGRIFATLWTPRLMNVMVEEGRVMAAVEEHPRSCEVVRWGSRIAAVRVDLDAADPGLLADLLEAAWEFKR